MARSFGLLAGFCFSRCQKKRGEDALRVRLFAHFKLREVLESGYSSHNKICRLADLYDKADKRKNVQGRGMCLSATPLGNSGIPFT